MVLHRFYRLGFQFFSPSWKFFHWFCAFGLITAITLCTRKCIRVLEQTSFMWAFRFCDISAYAYIFKSYILTANKVAGRLPPLVSSVHMGTIFYSAERSAVQFTCTLSPINLFFFAR